MNMREEDELIQKLDNLEKRHQHLINTLISALALTDAMMTELKRLQEPPTLSVIVAKSNFDNAMKKLLGGQPEKGKDPKT